MDTGSTDRALPIPLRDRIGCTIQEACAATGLKPTKLYELIGAGAIETKKVGKRRLVLVRSLLRLIEGEPGQGSDSTSAAA
jgi:excisionase family DNA binding protein